MSTASVSARDTNGSAFAPASLLGNAGQGGESASFFQELLEKYAESCIPHVEKITGEGLSPTVSLVSLGSETAGEVLGSLNRGAVTGLFEVPSIQSRLLVSMEQDFVELVIELMCGGMCSEPPPETPRAATSIDRQFARVAFNLLASTLERQCLGFGLGTITFGQIETKLDPLVLGKRTGKTTVATLELACRERRATVRLAFPQVFVDRFKQEALPAGPSQGAADPVWTEHFQSEIGRTVVQLDACLDANSLKLGDVATLKIGQILTLPKMASARCELRNGKKLLFRCELGQSEGRYSVRIIEAAPDSDAEAARKAGLANLFDMS